MWLKIVVVFVLSKAVIYAKTQAEKHKKNSGFIFHKSLIKNWFCKR